MRGVNETVIHQRNGQLSSVSNLRQDLLWLIWSTVIDERKTAPARAGQTANFLKLLYLRFQQFPRKVYPAFDGTQRFLQHVCDFMVFITIKIKQEGIPEYFR